MPTKYKGFQFSIIFPTCAFCHPDRWEHLKSLAAERRSLLDTALQRAQHFYDNWKRESDWLTEAERRAYADWTPRGLPETCDEEIKEHEVC